ncbi:MAG: hypothetical protein ABSF53_09560, partial [Terracidiphilus sp.]
MQDRKTEDRLRQEYFDVLPDVRRVIWYLEAEVRYHTRFIVQRLRSHEQLVVKSRVKECESAVKTLRDQQEGRTFDPDNPDGYSLLSLPDLAGVRVLVFPNSRLVDVDAALRNHFPDWVYKPVKDDRGATLAPKYYGYCSEVSNKVLGEYQIVPMLLGLFWEVEHSAMYKFREVANSKEMQMHRTNVERALS